MTSSGVDGGTMKSIRKLNSIRLTPITDVRIGLPRLPSSMSSARAEMPMTPRAEPSCRARAGDAPDWRKISSNDGETPKVMKVQRVVETAISRKALRRSAGESSTGGVSAAGALRVARNRLRQAEEMQRQADEELQAGADDEGDTPAEVLVEQRQDRPEDGRRKTREQHEDGDDAFAVRTLAFDNRGITRRREAERAAEPDDDPGKAIDDDIGGGGKQQQADREGERRGRQHFRGAIAAEPAPCGWTGEGTDDHHHGQTGKDHLIRQAERWRDDAAHDAEHIESGAPADKLGDCEHANCLRRTKRK